MSYGYGTEYTPNRIMGRPTIPDDPNACGTNRGIWQHKRAGQKNCDKCREKQNANRRASYRAQMANILAQEKSKGNATRRNE